MLIEVAVAIPVGTYLYYLKNGLHNRSLNNYELNIGYTRACGIKIPIIVDMRITPHVFVCGLSLSGKTKMVEYAIQGKQAVLLNAYEHDFSSIKAQRIVGNKNILDYLEDLTFTMKNRPKRDKPLFVVIDELLTLCNDKKIVTSIAGLLADGRHYDIYLVGISQEGTKEAVKFKNLFNTRVCFRQVEESSYRVVLGYSPEDTNLRQRQFYLYSDKIVKGYTHTI